ncbi:EAL domain-containing protein [Halorhodospira halochloris]|uniref:bifunctional diguanylate cyclase/phosphodiesterase n=1 Tax=Halorhodospira halochloris TaxID=1052 RepID=UPI001EE85B7B|nr:EAL domain-containing protein [Halorhodospira halochloris]
MLVNPSRRALYISLAYVVLALAWIFGSDAAVVFLFPPEWSVVLQLAKGVVFVLVTAMLLFWLLSRIERYSSESQQLRKSQLHAQQMRDTYAALSAANHAMMKEGDKYNLFTQICQIVVHYCGVRMAWIGLVEPDGHWVVPVAWDGDELGKWYLKQIRVSSDPELPEGRGPVGRSLATQQTVLFQDFMEDPDAAPWHYAARQAGFAAVAAFPLSHSGQVIGSLAVYASDEGYFSAEVIALIEDLAADVGFAVEAMERETERRRQNERIEYLAQHDLITGLLNRSTMTVKIDEAIGARRGDGKSAALLFINLDRFRFINDAFGYHTGDILLHKAAQRLRSLLGPGMELSRHGADEFLVLINEVSGREEGAALATQIIDSFSLPLRYMDLEHTVSPSIGVAIYPQDATDSAALINNAEIAMQAAKRGGRSRFCNFTVEMQSVVQHRLALEANLRGALERGEIELWYQPQLDIKDMRLVGVEALMRWCHPERGWVSPGEFIPIAEESGLIVELGDWAIAEACAQAAQWHSEGLLAGPVAVNVSAAQLIRGGMAEKVDSILARSNISAPMLQLEMTESMFLHESGSLSETLESFNRRGLRLAVDDFGTGYSNLGYLKRLPLAKLKIDKSFVLSLPDDVEDAVITRTIVSMAVGLNLRVIAEGVETREQLAYLQQIGCHEGQGFLFGRPQPPDELTARMRSAQGWLVDE